MKRVLNILFLLFCIQFSFAQSLVVSGGDYFTSDPMTDISHHLDLMNNSSNPITVVCQKTIISMPNNLPSWAGPSYCFAGNCYSASSTLPSSAAILGAGQEFRWSNNDLEAFSGYYVPAEVPGTSVVEYCFYDQNNPADESCVSVTYQISASTSINETDLASGFFPNPASDYTIINYTPKRNYIFELVDVLGNKVKDIDLSSSGQERLYVGELSNGIYFGSFIHLKAIGLLLLIYI